MVSLMKKNDERPSIDLKALIEKLINLMDIETVQEKLKEVRALDQQGLTGEITRFLERRFAELR
jgi:hypothetical protein